MKFMGIDTNGYRYYLHTDNYIYQKHNKYDVFIGWFCSGPAWERTFKSKLGLCPNTVFHQNVEDGIETNHDQCAHCKTL